MTGRLLRWWFGSLAVAALLVASLAVVTSAGAAPAERSFCDARATGSSLDLWITPHMYKNTHWDFLGVPEGAKVRVDARATYDPYWPPIPQPPVTMYQVLVVFDHGPQVVLSESGGRLWFEGLGQIDLTERFLRCAERLPDYSW
jgi:hypothetical protein